MFSLMACKLRKLPSILDSFFSPVPHESDYIGMVDGEPQSDGDKTSCVVMYTCIIDPLVRPKK